MYGTIPCWIMPFLVPMPHTAAKLCEAQDLAKACLCQSCILSEKASRLQQPVYTGCNTTQLNTQFLQGICKPITSNIQSYYNWNYIINISHLILKRFRHLYLVIVALFLQSYHLPIRPFSRVNVLLVNMHSKATIWKTLFTVLCVPTILMYLHKERIQKFKEMCIIYCNTGFYSIPVL